jgi:hypothetical protein
LRREQNGRNEKPRTLVPAGMIFKKEDEMCKEMKEVVVEKEVKLTEKEKTPKVTKCKKDCRLRPSRQMIPRTRRRSLDYKDMVKTVEETSEQE